MAVRKKHIQQLVALILDKHNVKKGPVPVEDIVKSYKIEIRKDNVDDNLCGFLFRDRETGKTVIGANKSHHSNRQRFTIAHELGHFLLHEGETLHLDQERGAYSIKYRNAQSSMGQDDSEKEANFFAAELLMPERIIRNELKGVGHDLLDEDGLRDLASKLSVSVQALTIRLTNLGLVEL